MSSQSLQSCTLSATFLNNSVKHEPILVIFDTWNHQNILNQQLIDFGMSPISCSHFTLENPKKNHFSTRFLIHTSGYLRYLRIQRTVTVIVHLPVTSEKCHRTTCEMRNSFVWWCLWKASCVVWHCWLCKARVVLCGNLKVRQATSRQVFKVTRPTMCMDKLTRFHCHWLIASSNIHVHADIQPMP